MKINFNYQQSITSKYSKILTLSFQKCLERGYATGDMVRIRIEGACSDLHGVEAKWINVDLFV